MTCNFGRSLHYETWKLCIAHFVKCPPPTPTKNIYKYIYFYKKIDSQNGIWRVLKISILNTAQYHPTSRFLYRQVYVWVPWSRHTLIPLVHLLVSLLANLVGHEPMYPLHIITRSSCEAHISGPIHLGSQKWGFECRALIIHWSSWLCWWAPPQCVPRTTPLQK